MSISVVIPTYKRFEKLKRCLTSLFKQTYRDFDIHVYCDNNDVETYESLQQWLFENNSNVIDVYPKLCMNQNFVVGCWNSFFNEQFSGYYNSIPPDAVLWCVDDVELYPDCIERAVHCMEKNFPYLEGIVGLNQKCPGREDYTFKWYGQCLIGKGWIERYEPVNYQVCCPDYNHFYQDYEVWLYANSMNKFINCPDAILNHYHPCFITKEMDFTHPVVRGNIKDQDTKIYNERRQKGLIWGRSWELICV